MKTLQEILIEVNSFVDLEAELPTGDELPFRSNLANQAIWDAASIAQFSEFERVYEVCPSTNATVSMPSDFREFSDNPRQLVNGGWKEVEEILPKERYNRPSNDLYCYVLGNPSEGYSTIFNGITANMTLSFTYQRFPSGLLTLTDTCELPDPTFVTQKTTSYVLQARGDDRFPYVDSVANGKLRNMVGRDMKTPGGGMRTTPVVKQNPLK